MEEIGKITKKVKTEDPEGSWTRFAFTINEKVFSSFDTENEQFNEGDLVKVDYHKSKDGKYNNVDNIEIYNGEAKPTGQTQIPSKKLKQYKVSGVISLEEIG